MIYTASQFNNELDVLEIRLETIGDMVDVIVLAESTVNQRGQKKPLHLPAALGSGRYSKWVDKIKYIIVDDMPEGGSHGDDVKRERWQRDSLIRGMGNLQSDDLVYVSDLDEIPTPEAFEDGLRNPGLRFGMDLHVYALNWRWLDRGCRIGTLGGVVSGDSILRQGVCGAILWDSSVRQRPGVSGWHLTYQGGVDAIRAKITGMMDKAENLVYQVDVETILTDEWISNCIKTGNDVFGRVYRPTEWVNMTQLPPCVSANPEKYLHMTVPKPWNQDEIESQPRCTCGGVFNSARELGHFSDCQLTPTFTIRNKLRPRALEV